MARVHLLFPLYPMPKQFPAATQQLLSPLKLVEGQGGCGPLDLVEVLGDRLQDNGAHHKHLLDIKTHLQDSLFPRDIGLSASHARLLGLAEAPPQLPPFPSPSVTPCKKVLSS